MLSRLVPLAPLSLLAALTSCQQSAPPRAPSKASTGEESSACPRARRDSAVAGARGYEDSRGAALASSIGRSLAFACLDQLRGSAEERLEFEVAFEVDGEGNIVKVNVEPEGAASAILRACLDGLSKRTRLPPPDHAPGKVRSFLAVNNPAPGARPPAPAFIDVTQAYRVLGLDVQFYRHQDLEVPRGFVEYDVRNAFIKTNAILVLVDVEKPNYPLEDDDSVLKVVLDAHDGNPIESTVRLRHFRAGAGATLTVPVLLYPHRALCDTVTVSAKTIPNGPNSDAEMELPFTCGE